MYQAELSDGRLTLSADGKPLLVHTAQQPFLIAVRRENACKSARGSVGTQMREAARIPLTDVARTAENEYVFSAPGHCVRAAVTEQDGCIRISLSGTDGWAYELRLPAEDGEAILGGGMQPQLVNLRCHAVVNSVYNHPSMLTLLQKSGILRSSFRADSGKGDRSDVPMPVFVTDHGRLMAFAAAADGASRFGKEEYRFTFDRCPDALLLAQSADYYSLAHTLAAQFSVRQYLPDWCHDGMILGIQGDVQASLGKIFAMLDAGAAICGVWVQAAEPLRPEWAEAAARLRERGVHFLTSIDPCLVKGNPQYDKCRENGWLITRQNGEIYHTKSKFGEFGRIDLTNPDAVGYVKDVLIKRNMLDLGVSGWVADPGEPPPPDCVLYGGDPALVRSEWPLLWAKLNREAIEESGRGEDVCFLMRPVHPGVQTYAPVLWNGGCFRDFGHSETLPAYFSLGFSGVPMYCGAFCSFSLCRRKHGAEQLLRQMEFHAFSLLLGVQDFPLPRMSSSFDASLLTSHIVRLSTVHSALKPYLLQCVAQAREGYPAMRPDFYESMAFSTSHDPCSYFLGDELYVCPVVARHATCRRVFLPKGVWVHLWSAKVYTGGEWYTVPAPLGEIPVFYRANGKYLNLFREAADRAGQNAVH